MNEQDVKKSTKPTSFSRVRCVDPGVKSPEREYDNDSARGIWSVKQLPITIRGKMSRDQLETAAAMTLVGEGADMSLAQSHILCRAYYNKPKMFSLMQWLDVLLNVDNGVLRMECSGFIKDFYQRKEACDTRRRTIMREMADAVSACKDKLRILEGVNLRTCLWGELCDIGMRPLSASHFLMQTRPCEHVALISPILEWMKDSPAIYTSSCGREITIPDMAPEDRREYGILEAQARRMQIFHFPGMTSCEAERVIVFSRYRFLERRQDGSQQIDGEGHSIRGSDCCDRSVDARE